MSMHHLGVMGGTGRLAGSDAKASVPPTMTWTATSCPLGKVVASGGLRMPAEVLSLAIGRNDLRLLFTENRSVLTVRFSSNRHKPH